MMVGRHTISAWAAIFALCAFPAAAQQRTIQVAVNGAELIRLDTAPGSVLIANPAIADVVVEGGSQVFVLGRAPGETQLYVLDSSGGTMLRAAVSVLPPTARHVTVIRGDEETHLHCAPRCAAVVGQEKKSAGTQPRAGAASAPAATTAATPSNSAPPKQ